MLLDLPKATKLGGEGLSQKANISLKKFGFIN